uniref:Uncharacterized protein n=2 Tax=Oryza sativa subsp. japonica TaxID=39947 RepID=Q53N49_ORYSJ|nr:hypothetical protein LOC_Os11g16690 [Oryza sativa Japonica Group]ABA92601.1 hypothetical protein LOC_Os11g16690 [Oryza sativa Japonica Group]
MAVASRNTMGRLEQSIHQIERYASISRRMDILDMQTGEIQYNLKEHIAQTQEWQQNADAQFNNINNLMQQ